MKLLTKELINKFNKIGSQENIDDPIIVAKFFHPFSNYTWYATEYNDETKMFFGMVHNQYKEMGYFSFMELFSLIIGGIHVERDLYFTRKKLSDLEKENK
tara:strand:- start:1618 stop:1917 length:300 start_codon:yes stop_codon:yes gene_type:complete